jgi:hypothetical protein
MLQLQLLEPVEYEVSLGRHRGTGAHLLFALGVEVYPAHLPFHLIEADVVEAFEACASYGPNAMVGHQEMLLPPHKNVLSLRNVVDGHRALSCLLLERPKGIELGPVAEIHLVVGAPVLVLGEKAIFRADDLALEVGCERGMVLG